MQLEFLGEKKISIEGNETILQASLKSGIPHFHICGGNAKCSTCRVLVVEGSEALTLPNEKEKLLNKQIVFPPNVRLACQTKVRGENVILKRIIQDETDIDLYIGNKSGVNNLSLGEEKELSLFFFDIRNFTRFVGRHPAFDVVHVIQKLFSVFQKLIQENKGRIIETTGDGFYAVFGYEQKQRNENAEDAVHAAFLILAKLDELNEKYFLPYFNENIEIGIGIHIGKVVSGTVAIANEMHCIVMGYPVNIASRLQDATKELNNDLIVSSEIYELLSNPPKSDKKTILVKGIPTPLKVYLLGDPYLHSNHALVNINESSSDLNNAERLLSEVDKKVKNLN